MKRSSFLKRLFAGAIGLTSLPAVAKTLGNDNNQLVAPIEPVVEEEKPSVVRHQYNKPISLRVENTSPNKLRRIDIINTNGSAIDPYITQKDEWLIPGGKIYSTIPGVSYRQVIDYIKSCPFMAGMIYVGFHGNQSAFKNSLTVVSKDAYGNMFHCIHPFCQYKSPYDCEDKTVAIKTSFPIDLFTVIQLYELKPGCKADIRIYPLAELNQARSLFENEIRKQPIPFILKQKRLD